MSLAVVILAAGLGTRMQSSCPKVLHKIAGKPILEHVLATVEQLNPTKTIVIYGHKGEQLKSTFFNRSYIMWIEQEKQLGTGHAVLQALPLVKDVEKVLILSGDVPFVTEQTIRKLFDVTLEKGIGFITQEYRNPTGFGRVIRNTMNNVIGIVEEKEATDLEKQIKEINAAIYYTPSDFLQMVLPTLSSQNTQKEYYLTDMIALAASKNIPISTATAQQEWEVMGINDKVQLADLERCYQQVLAQRLMLQGVTILDPNRLDIRGDVTIGQDVVMDVNVILEGEISIGNRVIIGPNTWIKNSIIQDDVTIKANSMIEETTIGKNSIIGPFARIRPGTELASNVQIGNFVEIKNTQISSGSKINHLSYVGDAIVGTQVNIGAGTITCNYDGTNKHQTIIGDHVFIGSDTQLIAPVTVGDGATIGAGTTVIKDVPPKHLTHNRVEHRNIANWVRKNESEEKL